MSSISSVSSLGFTGLASGIDSDKLIEGLLATQRAAITRLDDRRTALTEKQDAFKKLEANLLSLSLSNTRLARSVAGTFDSYQAKSSDESILKAAAGSTATPGSYSLKVTQLAQSHQIASAGFADASTLLKTGTLQLRVGTGATTTITVDNTNNTLQGLASSINSAGGDVRASVINDGSGTPYRLLLTSRLTGDANDIAVTNNLTGGTGSAINLDPGTQTIQAAKDANVVLGSGVGAITLASANNQVNDVIPGVTLDLLAADTNKTLTLTVRNDTEAAKKGVQEFVDAYNDLVDFIDERDNFDEDSQTGGVFLGNTDVINLKNDLESVLSGVVAGVSSQMNRLSAVGITFTDTGRLSFDSSKLDKVLNGEVAGLSARDVKRMFAFTGESTNTGISFVLGSKKTQAPTAPVSVDITQVATQASVTASNVVAAPVTIDGTNKSVTLKLSGRQATLELAEGTYNTAADLARELQGKINASTDLSPSKVVVAVDAGKLKITTETYGSAASVEFVSGSGLAPLGFTAGQKATGQDVKGTFTINGVSESATGAGQTLTGNAGNANTDGLQIRVTLVDGQLVAGAEGSLTLTRGLASKLDQSLNRYLDPAEGRMKSINTRFQQNMELIDNARERQTELMAMREEALVRQFAAMEAAVSQLQSMGSQLGAQLSSLGSLAAR